MQQELQKAGVLVDLAGLTPTRRGARVRYSGKKHPVIDGPFAESKEVIAGYFLIEVKTLAEAIEWAKRAPFSRSSRTHRSDSRGRSPRRSPWPARHSCQMGWAGANRLLEVEFLDMIPASKLAWGTPCAEHGTGFLRSRSP